MRSEPEDAAAPRRTRVFLLWVLVARHARDRGLDLAGRERACRRRGDDRGQYRPAPDTGTSRSRARRQARTTCTNELDEKDEKIGCTFSVPTGTTLTFRATPKPVEALRAATRHRTRLSSRSSAAGAGPSARSKAKPCTVKTADDQEWVVAQFSPVWLEASLNGAGTVVAGGSRQIAPTSNPVRHGPVRGRHPGDGDRSADDGGRGHHDGASAATRTRATSPTAAVSSTCPTSRNFVSVGFDGFEPDRAPRSTRP